jgi:L-ascorbate metabolism protein UlaG (beta-lactamase superfamily)
LRLTIIFLAAIIAGGASDRGEYFTTDSGPVTITLVHHASFVIEGAGRVVYVDPGGEGNYKGLPKADLILITNDRPDHLDMSSIGHFSRKTTGIIAPTGAAARLPHSTTMNPGETVRLGEIMIEAEPVSPAGQGNGYVLTYPGLRVYISGDTAFYPEMNKIKNIDVAFLSVGTADTMSIEDAAKAVRAIKPKILYPCHYRDTSPDEIRKQLAVAAGTEVRMRNWY